MDKHFDFLMDELLNNALGEFQATDQYSLLKEKLVRVDQECETMFSLDEKFFVHECFETLLEVEGAKMQYVYRKGMLDSVKLLKQLGALV